MWGLIGIIELERLLSGLDPLRQGTFMNRLLAGSSRWTRRKLRGPAIICENAWNYGIIFVIIGLSTVLLSIGLLILVFRNIDSWIFSGLGLRDGLRVFNDFGIGHRLGLVDAHAITIGNSEALSDLSRVSDHLYLFAIASLADLEFGI